MCIILLVHTLDFGLCYKLQNIDSWQCGCWHMDDDAWFLMCNCVLFCWFGQLTWKVNIIEEIQLLFASWRWNVASLFNAQCSSPKNLQGPKKFLNPKLFIAQVVDVYNKLKVIWDLTIIVLCAMWTSCHWLAKFCNCVVDLCSCAFVCNVYDECCVCTSHPTSTFVIIFAHTTCLCKSSMSAIVGACWNLVCSRSNDEPCSHQCLRWTLGLPKFIVESTMPPKLHNSK